MSSAAGPPHLPEDLGNGAAHLDDEAFLSAFEDTTLRRRDFDHRSHLRLAWLYLTRHGEADGSRRFAETVLRYSIAVDRADKYNETLTEFWLAMIRTAMRAHPSAGSLDDLLTAEPTLADRGLQYRYYSPARLKSQDARQHALPPDLKALPA